MQIQQNSCLHSLQFMWLQPWFFSMRVLHLGHFFVLAKIQLAVSLSFMHLVAHSESCAHEHGSWASSPHRKQNGWVHAHRTVVTPEPTATLSHPAAGQYRIVLLVSMKLRNTYVLYLAANIGSNSAWKNPGGTRWWHLCSGQRAWGLNWT